jgi:hypothetical protein
MGSVATYPPGAGKDYDHGCGVWPLAHLTGCTQPSGHHSANAKDAAVIADQVRMNRDLQPLRAGDEISIGLRLLTARPD